MPVRALVLLTMLWLAGCAARPLAVSPRALAPHARALTIAGTAAVKVPGEAAPVRVDADAEGYLERRVTQAKLALHVVDDAGRIESLEVRSAHLAGQAHPRTGVPFEADGFPDVWRHQEVPDVRIERSGSRSTDFARANAAVGLRETPAGNTWHHHHDPGFMQLIEAEGHRRTGCIGGFSR